MTKGQEPPAADYFKQEFYFSRSRGEFVSVEDMPFQQALFSHRKLLDEFGSSYKGTQLYRKFMQKLCPTAGSIRQQLDRYGKACHAISDSGLLEIRVRNKFYRAVRGENKKVTTHKVGTKVGSYMEATVPVRARKTKVKA